MKIFFHLLFNNVIASVTTYTVWFALTFYAYLQTQSVMVTGIISGLFLVFTSLSGFWFGSLVDNYKKKTMMLISSFLTFVAFAIGLSIYLTSPTSAFSSSSSITLWVFIVVLMLGVVVSGIRNIAMPTLVTLIAPEDKRDKANGMLGTASGISFLLTSVFSGLLVASSGMYWVLILSLIFTLLTAIHLYFLPVPELKTKAGAKAKSKSIDIRGTIKIINTLPGFMALILFTTFNNFLGGVFMSLMDAYGLSLVSVQSWGIIWGFLSTGFILGGLAIAKYGLGKSPINTLFKANIIIWIISALFTIYPSIVLLIIGMAIYISIVPFIEASEQTIIQKVVPVQRQGRVFGFAHSVEQSASPLTAFIIGPLTQFIFIPFMTTGSGVNLIGSWFGTGPARGIALVFTITGVIGLIVTLIAKNSRSTQLLAKAYQEHSDKQSTSTPPVDPVPTPIL